MCIITHILCIELKRLKKLVYITHTIARTNEAERVVVFWRVGGRDELHREGESWRERGELLKN